jgi:hypothetical protein
VRERVEKVLEDVMNWFATSDFGGAACLLLIVAGTAAFVWSATAGRRR